MTISSFHKKQDDHFSTLHRTLDPQHFPAQLPLTILDARFPFAGIRISLLIDGGTISLRKVVHKIPDINKSISAGMKPQSVPFAIQTKTPRIYPHRAKCMCQNREDVRFCVLLHRYCHLAMKNSQFYLNFLEILNNYLIFLEIPFIHQVDTNFAYN